MHLWLERNHLCLKHYVIDFVLTYDLSLGTELSYVVGHISPICVELICAGRWSWLLRRLGCDGGSQPSDEQHLLLIPLSFRGFLARCMLCVRCDVLGGVVCGFSSRLFDGFSWCNIVYIGVERIIDSRSWGTLKHVQFK